MLAGPEAKEVTLLRDSLKWPANRTLFVDCDPIGVRKAQKMWPEAQTHHGWIESAIKQVDSIGFLNLDFMGKFNDSVLQTLQGARGKILPNAVVSYTFYRSREHYTHLSDRLVSNAAAEVLCKNQLNDLDLVRWVGATRLIEKTLALHHPEILLMKQYSSDRSAMGLLSLINGDWR